MKNITTCLFIALCLLLYGCATPSANTVTQISAIDALLAGDYDGSVTLKELSTLGDHAIGTFDALDGEMIMIDKTVYQVKSDGKAYKPDQNIKTPFASVVTFDPDLQFTIDHISDLASFEKAVAQNIPNKNLPCAIKIKGSFPYVKTRSVPAQKKPYKTLAQVVKTQPTFELTNVQGTIFGFYLPAAMKGLNVCGLHLHFLTADKTAGGHILDFKSENLTVKIDTLNTVKIIFPADTQFFASVDFSIDRSAELETVEK
jgi:acetolactate decarboxylase